MKRLAIYGLIALSVLLALACSLTSGIPTEEIRRQAIAILGDEIEEELVRDFIVVTPPPTFTITPTLLPCINPVSSGTYHLSVFNDQSGVADAPQFAYGPPDGQNTRWEGDSDVTRYWSYSLANVISGMITHTMVYTADDTGTSVDLYIHRERLVSVDEPGWVLVCSGLWSCSFSSEVGSLMYALSVSGDVQVDGAMLELSNGCEYTEVLVGVNTPTPTLTPTRTPTATIEISNEPPPTPEPTEAPTEAPTDVATPVPPPTLPPLPTLPPSPTLLPSPTVLPTPTFPPPPTPTVPPAPPPADTPTPEPPPVVAFSAASYAIAENGGSATITVVLNKTSPVPVTVNYATSNGTATASSDYTASSGVLTFSPGQTSVMFNVPISADALVEGSETIILTLSGATNASLGAPNPATLTIIDNDIFGTSASGGNLLGIDVTTGNSSTIGSMGVAAVPALAIDPTTGIMYAGGGGIVGPIVYMVNPNTGAATMVGDSGLGFAAIGAMEFTSGGTLYAAVNIAGDGGTGSDHLATINKATGVATIIGPFGTCTGVSVPSGGGGSCTLEGMEGIAFVSGTLYGSLSARGAAGTPGLYTINVTTGAATFVAPILDAGGTPPSGGVVSLKFHNGILYGGTARAIPPPADGGRLVIINPTTGLFSFVGATSATGGPSLGALAAPL